LQGQYTTEKWMQKNATIVLSPIRYYFRGEGMKVLSRDFIKIPRFRKTTHVGARGVVWAKRD
jgi:tricorn protease-like protein